MRLVRSLFFLGILFASVPASAGLNRWTTNGPLAGHAKRVAIDPGDPEHLLVPADILFESRDGGATWKSIVGPPVPVWAVTFDPVNPSIVYAGGLNGVFKSFDNAKTWIQVAVAPVVYLPPISPVTEIAIDPQSPSTLYAITFSGIFRSLDSGCSWLRLSDGLPFIPPASFSVTSVTIDPTNPAVLYLATLFNGAYKSVDHGDHWTVVGPGILEPSVSRIFVDPSNPGRLFAATNYFLEVLGTTTGALYRSLDAGASWSRVSSDTQTEPFNDVAIDTTDASTVYAGSPQTGILKSVDGGNTWSPMTQGLVELQVSAVVSSPLLPGTLFASTSAGIFVSQDRASHWTASSDGMIAYYSLALAIDPANPQTIYSIGLGKGPGVYKSTDGGGSWTAIDNGLPHANRSTAITADPTIPARVWVATDSPPGAFLSTNGGASWASRSLGIHAIVIGPFAIDRLNSARMVVGSSEGVYRSTDGGSSWSPVGPSRDTANTLFFDSADSQVLYLVSQERVMKSVDFGTTWNAVGGLSGQRVVTLVQSRRNSSRFLAGVVGGVMRSDDNGTTWTSSSVGMPPAGVSSVRFDPTNDLVVYASTGTIYMPGGIELNPQGVFSSHDGGATWSPINSGLTGRAAGSPLDVSDLAVDPSGRTIYAGTAEGVFRYDASPTPAPSVSSVSPNTASPDGGDPIVIHGASFSPNATVSIGGSAATSVTVLTATQIQVVTPVGPSGAADVTVTTADTQTAVLRNGLVYDFRDVPAGSPYHSFVATLARDGITGGCGPGIFCPDAAVTRAQAAVMIETALHGAGFGLLDRSQSFDDFDTCGPLARFIYGLVNDGIAAGCGPAQFCPGQPVTRAQVAVFLLRAKHGASYVPPPCTGIFDDVPCGGGSPGFAVDWIEELFHEEITAGCSAATNSYCPTAPVTRAQAAVFLVRALGL